MLRLGARQCQRAASTLLLAETSSKGDLLPITRNAVTCAAEIGHPIDIAVASSAAGKASESAAVKAACALPGVRSVLALDDVHSTSSESLSSVLATLATSRGYSHVVAASATVGKSAAPRAAGLLGSSPLADVVSVNDAGATFTRAVYAGNALETVECSDAVKVITSRGTSFEPCADSGGSAEVEVVPGQGEHAVEGTSEWVGEEVRVSDKPQLSGARVVVAGGRGMKNGENFEMLETLADALGGAVGASRAAVDAGWVPNDLQVGQTGKIVAPELYIAVGISGAIQHLAGMKDSKVIACINKDPEAPIFQVSDYGLVADLFTAVPELTKAVSK